MTWRDQAKQARAVLPTPLLANCTGFYVCLLYTSDHAWVWHIANSVVAAGSKVCRCFDSHQGTARQYPTPTRHTQNKSLFVFQTSLGSRGLSDGSFICRHPPLSTRCGSRPKSDPNQNRWDSPDWDAVPPDGALCRLDAQTYSGFNTVWYIFNSCPQRWLDLINWRLVVKRYG